MALSDRDRLIANVTEMVRHIHGGDWSVAFRVYDVDHDNRINADELNDVLRYSGVGNFLTRGAYVRAVFQEVDTDRDNLISFEEFQAVFQPGK